MIIVLFLRWNKLVSSKVCGDITLSGQDLAPVGRSPKLKIIKALNIPYQIWNINVAVHFEPSPRYKHIHLQQQVHVHVFNRPKISAMNICIPSRIPSPNGTPAITRSHVPVGGGWKNPLEKYAQSSNWIMSPQIRGENSKNAWVATSK